MFAYDASAGTGIGEIKPEGGSRVSLEFDPATVDIPTLSFRTTKVLGLPIPPPLQIAIDASELKGWLDTETGQAELSFDANFTFTAGPVYKPPSLKVKTILSTEDTTGRFRSASGQRFVGSQGKLVGIADVPKTGDWLLDSFLQLPTDAFAALSAELEIV
eukprot:jgi/Ulvmu1/8889/UM049_0071.1